MRTKRFLSLVGLSSLLSISAAALAVPSYSITPLANDGSDCYIKGVNDSGQVVGWTIGTDGLEHAAYWDPSGAQHALGELTANPGSRAYDINNSGQIVGQSLNSNSLRQATLWTTGVPGTANALSSLGVGSYSSAFGINNAGNIVGTGKALHGQHAIVWDADGTAHDYGSFAPDANLQIAGFNCINSSGKIGGTGYYLLDPFKATTSQLGSNTLSDISTPVHTASESLGINSAGTIVGYSANQPVIFNGDHTVQNLGLLDFDSGQANGINDAGTIVGSLVRFTDDGVVQDSFVYTGGVMYDLLDLLDSSSTGWTTLFEATAINQNGQIVGEGVFNGEVRGFVLSEVPEPTSLAIIPLMIGGFARRRRK